MAIYFGNGSGSPQADRRYTMALQLAEWGDHAAAADLLVQGLEMAPGWPPLHFHLGEALRQAENNAAAAEAFRAYLALDPADAMGAAIKLSLLGDGPPLAAMPEEYVRSLFDQYAPRFEQSLVGNLAYHTPELMTAMVAAHRAAPFQALLDLGCGTGLAAGLFRGRAGRMTGVDLAPAMIEQARAKNLYDALHVRSIDAFLKDAQEAAYDLVLAADVFVYIGALEPAFEGIARALLPGGLFCFSLQSSAAASKAQSWSLGPDHRYAHSGGYADAALHSCGLTPLKTQSAVLRLDGGNPIHGTITLARKPATPA